ncbi:MAG: hypothetical protein ABFD64_14070 [Armatimonadota bacterium]
MFATIRQGERVAVWDKRGRVEMIDGPRRVYTIGRKLEKMMLYAAGTDEYLAVVYKNGRSEHLRGPVSVWFNPVLHESISVQKAFAIDANEAVVVYRQDDDHVDRRVVRGPDMYVPAANEWLHNFCWHGSDPKDPNKKVYGALRFAKLRIIPDQMYFDVCDVRTADDALLVIKLMIFFELTDIEKMLDQTHDPVADFINAVTADVIDFVVALPFERFKEQTNKLNDLETYPQLIQRGERIGYKINKVVYRGYHASATLQNMHDQAIEARTKLKLESETENQAQELADLRLEREAERAKQRREMEESEERHKIQLQSISYEETLRQLEAEQERDASAKRMVNEIEEEHQKAMDREQIEFLQSMKGMNIDLTRYLVAQYQNPDRLIRIEDGQKSAQLHLHE